ncbi:MAG: PIG-L family deacetylase [Acidobacteriia bacterium]|nr:PIG-L family deacetylase [Terriglobia bacterium]
MAHRLRSRLTTVVIAVVLACGAGIAQEIPAPDRGSNALVEMLSRLRTTARLLHTTAHPDDDDGSMLAYESRGQGAETMMLTLNRGEGGQNKFGAALSDELGILRTLELLEADRFYGVEQRFTRVVDFGYSKTADETFQKWRGHDAALADMVRVIRTFRPDVIVSRFDGSGRDGHGNHQASGILSREAFRAAADSKRFPEQIREGLFPWQAKKLYIGNIRGEDGANLRLNVGTYDPVLGTSFAQFATEGLKHQMSQGVGGFYNPPGNLFRTYRLVDSVLPAGAAMENGFFDGIDTTLPGIAARLGSEEGNAPFLRPALAAIAKAVDDAAAAFKPTDPSPSAAPLLTGLKQINVLIEQVNAAQLSPAGKAKVLTDLRTKQRQLEEAANLALGMELDASVDAERQQSFFGFFRQEETFQMAVPGQTFTVTARLYNRGRQTITAKDIELELPAGWQATKVKSELRTLASNEQAWAQFQVTVPGDARYTRPYWHRDDPLQAVYTIDDPLYATLPLPPWPVQAHASFKLAENTGSISSVAKVKFIDPTYGQSERPLAVGPPLAIEVDPPVQVTSTHRDGAIAVTVGVRNNVNGVTQGAVRLHAPRGWRVTPESQPAEFSAGGESKHYTFHVTPAEMREGVLPLRAVLEYDGKQYAEGYEIIGRRDIGDFYYYRPAEQKVSAVDVMAPANLRVGYIMGAGDDIPTVLQQLGVQVEMITPGDLASGDLSRFHTIVLGIRTYDVRTDVRAYNRRLLDYVNNGGTLLVQYNASMGVFNAGHFTPYPASLSYERVTVEEAPVQILDAANPIFRSPNRIGEGDFKGWVQERGLYFMGSWDPHFKPLLSSHDPEEPAREGGLLVAPYGKGFYIYTGYAFFRQLPAGVPGAVRLFVNLLSASASQQAVSGDTGARERLSP